MRISLYDDCIGLIQDKEVPKVFSAGRIQQEVQTLPITPTGNKEKDTVAVIQTLQQIRQEMVQELRWIRAKPQPILRVVGDNETASKQQIEERKEIEFWIRGVVQSDGSVSG